MQLIKTKLTIAISHLFALKPAVIPMTPAKTDMIPGRKADTPTAFLFLT